MAERKTERERVRPVHSHSLLPTSPLLISSSGNTHILQLWRNSVTNTHRMDSTHTRTSLINTHRFPQKEWPISFSQTASQSLDQTLAQIRWVKSCFIKHLLSFVWFWTRLTLISQTDLTCHFTYSLHMQEHPVPKEQPPWLPHMNHLTMSSKFYANLMHLLWCSNTHTYA